jgi:hypothetical protein
MVSNRSMQADDEAFEAHISPLRESLRDLLDVSDRLRNDWGTLPNPQSRVMGELDEETPFALRVGIPLKRHTISPSSSCSA